MRKLLTIIALSIVGILGATVITLAFVKSNFNQVSTANIDYITVYYGTEQETFMSGDEIYDTIMAKYLSGTRESVLSSLFQGAYSSDADAEIIKNSFSSLPTSGTIYLRFAYDVDHYPTITLNGNVYEDETLTTTDQTVQIKYAYITIENSDTLTKITAYYVQAYNNDSSTSGNYRVQFVTHHSDLYDYLDDLYEDGMFI